MSFYPTVRKSIKINDVIISYSNPSIQCYKENSYADSLKDVLYFYYDIEMLYKNKVVFQARVHDFPKVSNLSGAVDYILSDEGFMLEGEHGDEKSFHRYDYYKRYTLQEHFEMEYGMRFECEKTKVKQYNESDYKVFKYYKLHIFNPRHLYNKWIKDEDIYSSIAVNVTEKDLIKLKQLAEEFVEASISSYNTYEAPEVIQYYKENGLE